MTGGLRMERTRAVAIDCDFPMMSSAPDDDAL